MDIVMTRKTPWLNLIVPIGAEISLPDDLGQALIKRGVARDKAAPIGISAEEMAVKHVKHLEALKEKKENPNQEDVEQPAKKPAKKPK